MGDPPERTKLSTLVFHPSCRSRRDDCQSSRRITCAFPASVGSVLVVRRVVIGDQIDFFVSRYGPIDHAQKSQPLLMAVLLRAQAVDFAPDDTQPCKQGVGAVALVIMRHGSASAVLHGQARLRAL